MLILKVYPRENEKVNQTMEVDLNEKCKSNARNNR